MTEQADVAQAAAFDAPQQQTPQSEAGMAAASGTPELPATRPAPTELPPPAPDVAEPAPGPAIDPAPGPDLPPPAPPEVPAPDLPQPQVPAPEAMGNDGSGAPGDGAENAPEQDTPPAAEPDAGSSAPAPAPDEPPPPAPAEEPGDQAGAFARADDAGAGSDGDGDAESGEASATDHEFVADDAAAGPAAEEAETGFASLGLGEPILKALAASGYRTPTPIQAQAIPVVLMGRDVLGCAQTGTGKTASFVLPMMEILAGSRAKARMPRSLILEPTRELALQVAENFQKYGQHLNLVHALLIGGESMGDQRAVLDKGVDVLVATPGRLLDLFERGRILLADCKILVIDEADRMLDMGFIPDVERIVSMLPPMRQTLFFSATMAPEIRRLADAFLSNPKEITVSRPASVATTITTGLLLCSGRDKREALRRLIRREDVQNALIFCNRKRDVNILYKSLKRHGLSAGELHGDMDQPSRFATLNAFKAGAIRLLVCSDVAARGLDIGGLSHVFNFDVPFHAEDYVHRIGRTGRAGREGHAYTIASPEELKLVAAVEKLTGHPIPRLDPAGLAEPPEAEEVEAAEERRGRHRPGERRTVRVHRDAPPSEAPREERPRAEERPRREERAPRPDHRDRGERDRAERGRDVRPAAVAERAPERAAAERPSDRDRGAADRPWRQESAQERRPYQGGREEHRDRDGRDRDRGRDRRGDDLGPPVKGFGDDVPAFMTIPIPRFRRTAEDLREASEAA